MNVRCKFVKSNHKLTFPFEIVQSVNVKAETGVKELIESKGI